VIPNYFQIALDKCRKDLLNKSTAEISQKALTIKTKGEWKLRKVVYRIPEYHNHIT
tara:strand:+ start:630 stop:797 length:168 start_codon:yes stop_codon:yes gene_type:complete